MRYVAYTYLYKSFIHKVAPRVRLTDDIPVVNNHPIGQYYAYSTTNQPIKLCFV